MIRIAGLTKRFGALHVLRDVDLEIGDGKVTAIVGPNGAGKTTLMKTILGLTRSDAGKILIDGERVGDDPAYRSLVGYMPQIARFPENLSAAELIAMLRDLRGEDAEIDDELVRRFRLEGQLAKPLRVLSGGTRQKVNAVLAFLFRPELLVLDEPTAGLDPVSSGILKDKIAAVRDAGRTVLVTSHVLSELDALADDIAFLVDGRLRYAGSVHDLKVATRQLSLERAVAQVMVQDEGEGAGEGAVA
jgi:Cu-processing system ATP-binding protein